MRRIPVRNRIDGIAAANSPVNASSGRIDGSRSGYVSAVPAPGHKRDRDAADHGRGEDDGHRLRGGHRPVAGPADDDEGGLAERRRQGEPEPDGVDADPGRRIELGGHDRDHPADRQDEGDGPRPVQGLAPERDVDARHDDRVGVEAEQREGHGHEVERDEHREVEREPEQGRHQQRQPGLAIEVGETGPSLRAARDPPGDEGAGCQQPDPAAPGHERQRLHPGVVGEPGQRPEHAEQRGGRDDDGEARDGRAIRSGHRSHGRADRLVRAAAGSAAEPGPRAGRGLDDGLGPGARVGAVRHFGGGRESFGTGRFVPRPTEADRGERHPELPEHLDRHEEPREQEEHAR